MVEELKPYKLNPEIYNHMNDLEKNNYNWLIDFYNFQLGMRNFFWTPVIIGVIVAIIFFVLSSSEPITKNTYIAAGIFMLFVMLGLSVLIKYSSSKTIDSSIRRITELEEIVQYRLNQKLPKAKIEDWDRKQVSRKEIKVEKSINIQTDKRFCSECGGKVRIGAKFCEQCGKQIKGSA